MSNELNIIAIDKAKAGDSITNTFTFLPYNGDMHSRSNELWAHTVPFIVDKGVEIAKEIGFKYKQGRYTTTIPRLADTIKDQVNDVARSTVSLRKYMFSMHPVNRLIDKEDAEKFITAMIGEPQDIDLQHLKFEYLKEPSMLMSTKRNEYNFVFEVTDPLRDVKQFIVVPTRQSKVKESMWQDVAYILYKKHLNEEIDEYVLDAVKGFIMDQDNQIYEEKLKRETLDLVEALKLEQLELMLNKLDEIDMTRAEGIKSAIEGLKSDLNYLKNELNNKKAKLKNKLRDLKATYLEDDVNEAIVELKDYILKTVPESLVKIKLQYTTNPTQARLYLGVKNRMSLDKNLLYNLISKDRTNPVNGMPKAYIELLKEIAEGEIIVYLEGCIRLNLDAKTSRGEAPLDGGTRMSNDLNIVNPHWGVFNCIGSLEDALEDALAHNQLIPMYQLAINAVGELNLDDMIVTEKFINNLVDGRYKQAKIYTAEDKYICELQRRVETLKDNLEVPF